MPLVVPGLGVVELLELLRTPLNGAGAALALYQNDYTPGPLSVFADFMPASFPGYSGPVFLNFPLPAAASGPGDAQITADPVMFRCGGGAPRQRIYGYFVYRNPGAVILWAERFDARQFMSNAGDFLGFQPVLTASSIY